MLSSVSVSTPQQALQQQQPQQQQSDSWILRGVGNHGGGVGASSSSSDHGAAGRPMSIRTVSVSNDLTKHLKPHQKEGVEFIYQNSFIDCNYNRNKNENEIG